MDKIQVLIIDEHSAVCRALASRLGAACSIRVVGATSDFAEGKCMAQSVRPDVTLLELKTGGGIRCRRALDPLSAVSELLASGSGSVVVLTSYLDEVEAAAAIDAGAKRYLLKDIDTAGLVHEIEQVARAEPMV